MGSFLLPAPFRRPPVVALLHETSLVTETSRHAVARLSERRTRRATPYARVQEPRAADPVILVPGFLAGDASLQLMARALRTRGFRTYRSRIHANVGCTLNAAAQLESRLESVAIRRGGRVQIVGHSLGGMLARGVAVRRPDLVSGIVTMGSPMLAPAAHHLLLTAGVETLVRLSRAGLPGLMSEDCVAGSCARTSFEEGRSPMPHDVAFTTLWSRRDGVVDWRACIDPEAVSVEVTASHVGMAVDPAVVERVSEALRRHEAGSALKVHSGVGA